MKNKLLLMCLFSSFAYSMQHTNTHVVAITTTQGMPTETSIGGIRSFCECGQPPVLVMFLFGSMQLYCREHMPEIERVRRVTPENLIEVLRREQ